ncbi:unnamed protein product [Rangifer tarandus platyrhynchus]|uniref:Uncharacterized protein n=1 Tax=Rangifer tarandus platyrhynchus TaxID=3082113 RepID=A0ABN8Y5U2_RANTA|nr:unnamed protein product [Rangifer tarandus platyrhynchus]
MPRGHPRQRVGRPGCRAGGRAPPLPGASRCSSGSRGGSRSGRDNFSPASKAAAARPAPGPPTRPRPPLGPAPGPAPGRRLVKDAGEKVLASGSRRAEEEVRRRGSRVAPMGSPPPLPAASRLYGLWLESRRVLRRRSSLMDATEMEFAQHCLSNVSTREAWQGREALRCLLSSTDLQRYLLQDGHENSPSVCQAVATWHNQKQHIGVHPRDLRQNPNSAEMENSRHLLVERSLTSSTGYE